MHNKTTNGLQPPVALFSNGNNDGRTVWFIGKAFQNMPVAKPSIQIPIFELLMKV